MRNSGIDVKPAGSVGAIIGGVDLSKPLDEPTYQAIRASLNQFGVLFFRDQDITPEQHVALGRRFGEVIVNPVLGTVPGHPLIVEVRKEPEQRHNHGGAWHSDEAFAKVPPLGSILVARVLPDGGGDTMFANLYKAYESLSDGLKKTLEELRAVHSIGKRLSKEGTAEKAHRAKAEDPTKTGVHPVVVRHPESGRKVLWLTPMYSTHFEGWTAEESASLIDYLCAHATRPENIYRFDWELGSVAFWDNRSTLHYAVQDYDGSRRLMHRVSIKGNPFLPI
jgi:taurine dioxygenase